jgi:glyoxylase-like metal-dependent hydrolase (beta-lactamase superfamily II)
MSDESYRFDVGAFQCILVKDGVVAYPQPAQMFFANAPKERLEQVLREHNLDPMRWDEYVSPYPSLLISTGGHRVLVDTGAGSLHPTTGKLLPNLRAEDVVPEDIDTVILTHCHRDHIGGTIGGEGRPAFPNARYVMWRDEWEFWAAAEPDWGSAQLAEPIKQRMLAFAREKLPPIRGQLDLVDREEEIVPGVSAVPAPGHTPGHMAVAVVSGFAQLLYISDTAIHPIHVEQPDWYSVFDLAPDQAVASRRQLLQRAAAERALVHGFHFPFPGLGHVVQAGDAWAWQPIETAANP